MCSRFFECRFVTAMKDPKRLVQRAIAEAKREAELAERKEVAEARLKGKRLSSKRGRTAGEEETADEADEEEEGGKVGTGPVRFSPDASLLYKLVKTCQQRDVANAWYESFVTAAKIQPWQAVASNKRRKKRDLDESTALKCRFASALYELEKSGIIKCQSAGPHNPTVTIEKKIYTWI